MTLIEGMSTNHYKLLKNVSQSLHNFFVIGNIFME